MDVAGRSALRAPAVIGFVLGVVGLVLLVVPRSDAGESADVAEVTSVAGDFAVEYNTYDLADVADYHDRMEGLMSQTLFEEFTSVTDALAEAIEDKKQTSTDAAIQSVAVEKLTETSAEVLVAVDALVRNTDVEEAGAQRSFRWRMAMTKDGNDWVVDTFASVVSAEAGTVPKEDAK